MRIETTLFAAVSVFFAGAGAVYGWYGHDPAGTAALALSCLMTALIAFFLGVQARRRGPRPEDRKGAEIRERTGPVGFFPAGSPWPPVTAAGFALAATGVVVGTWLLLIGLGLTGAGVLGFAFQYAGGQDPDSDTGD